LQALVASEFWRDAPVQVVSFDRNERIARGWAETAAGFLRGHGYHAVSEAARSEGTIGEAILQAVQRHSAQLLVMGAYGKPAIREFFFGSVTRRILQAAAVPVFLDH
jgi:nucleotide-binding universal stress UspA family protein